MREHGVTEGEVVYRENKVELHHYEPSAGQRRDVPILLVYAVINRPYVLDIEPDRSVVRQFLDHGFEVYLVDWGRPSRLDRSLGLGDFVDRYLPNCVDVISERTGVDAPHVLGYCTGATLAVVYATLYPERVRTLGLLAPLLNFDADGGVLDTERQYQDPQQVLDTFGNAPGLWLSLQLSMRDPVEYHLARYLRAWEHRDDEEYLSRFARRLQWGYDPVDVAGELYRTFLTDLARENRLMEGTLTVGERTADLGALTMPVLTIVGEDDHFIPADASLPIVEAIPSEDTSVIEFPSGHVELSTGERAHAELWPSVCEWFAERSGGEASD